MFNVSWFSDRSVIIDDVPSPDILLSPVGLAAGLNRQGEEGWRARVGLTSVIVESSVVDVHLLTRVQAVLATFAGGLQPAFELPSPTLHTIQVVYDGEDLPAVADVLGVSADAVVFAHTHTLWEVSMLGFAPGFGYLTVEEGPVELWETISRLAVPRHKVPAGAVGVAAGMTAVYPQGMPGGWNLIGRTAVELFNASHADKPALFQPGDLVRFSESRLP